MKVKNIKKIFICFSALIFIFIMTACPLKISDNISASSPSALDQVVRALGQDVVAPPLDEINASLPQYNGSSYAWINGDRPYFGNNKIVKKSFEYYAPLDSLGRCGTCVACIGKDIMPTEERDSIGMVKPSGWHTVRYDIVEGQYLYNRCHLIAYQLTGENANHSNLITGTRCMNVKGMLPREELVADYVKRTGNHVLYRVTPVFMGDNLVASGVIMEAKSVEDNGDSLEFNVYVYNEQPGTIINHATGESKLEVENSVQNETKNHVNSIDYVVNTNTGKFHYPWCSSVSQMAVYNKYEYKGDRKDLIDKGYEPCGNCQP